MTKQQCDTMIEATREGKLFDWLYDHGSEIGKDELALIARELAYAMEPDGDNETISKHAIADTFIDNIIDFYSTYGFDDDEEEDE